MALEMHSDRPTVQIEVQARVFDVVGEHLALLVQIIVHMPVHRVFSLFLALCHFLSTIIKIPFTYFNS